MATRNQAGTRPPRLRRLGLEHEVFLAVLRTADTLLRDSEQILKPVALSNAQYNVLRILRGAGAQGLACCEIANRMITRDPDITRLLDRLESRGLVSRMREREDRRVVKTRITPEGLRILRELDEPMRQVHRRQVQHISRHRLQVLVRLLGEVREPISGESG